MDIDIYQQCPCHSGKKIKFCCGKDIVGELSQIVAKSQSNQSQSALDLIERVIAKHGERDCLLTLQTHILFVLGEHERAREVNSRFAARNPDHPIAQQHEAMSLLSDGNVMGAIAKLQDAMDSLKSDEIPLTMANSFRLLGSILLRGGQVIAARTHLQFALLIRGSENSLDLQRLIYESFRLPGLPLILKADFRLESAPPGKEWSGKYQNVVRAMNRGQFRLALRILERIDELWPNQKEVVRSIAILHSALANVEFISPAWRRLSQMDSIPRWQAVEAAALANLFLTEEPSAMLDIMVTEFELSSLDAVCEIAISSKRFEPSECPAEDPFDDGPAPRRTFQILDREKLDSVENRSAREIPLVIGEILLYGRQTNREPRMVLVSTANDTHSATKDFLNICFGGNIVSEGESEVISATSTATDVLNWNWHVPTSTPRNVRLNLIKEYRRFILVEKWTEVSFSTLDGLTPNQARDRADLGIALEALVLNLEQSSALQQSGEEDILALKRHLGIADKEDLDASNFEDELLTPQRLCDVKADSLSDDQLAALFARSMTIANTTVLLRITPEILNRPQLAETIPRDMCYSMLAQLSEDDEQALAHLQNARQAAKQAGHNVGLFLVQELEIRLSRDMTDKLPELFQTIQKQYLPDPVVEEQLVRVLTRFGLMDTDGKLVRPPSSQSDSSAEPDTVIWRPDSDPSPTAVEDSSMASKLWVPGRD